MEYKVKIVLTIFNLDKSKCTSGHRTITLPFAPYKGLKITEKQTVEYTLDSVVWSINEEYFYCNATDQESKADDGTFIDMGFLVDEAKSCGWSGFEKIIEL